MVALPLRAVRACVVLCLTLPLLLLGCSQDWSDGGSHADAGKEAENTAPALPQTAMPEDATVPAPNESPDDDSSSELDADAAQEATVSQPGDDSDDPEKTNPGPCMGVDCLPSPCAVDNGGCDSHATCTPNSAKTSVTCACSPDYAGDGKSCVWTLKGLSKSAPSLLHNLPSPVAIHSAAAGLAGSAYSSEATRLTKLHYVPASIASMALPDGTISYSSVFHKNASVAHAITERDLSATQYQTKRTEYGNQGYRPTDIAAHDSSTGARFSGTWVLETPLKPSATALARTRAEIDTDLTTYRAEGKRPIRLHGYKIADGTARYTGVWVQDALGIDYRVIIEASSSQYATEFKTHTDAGYVPVDISAYYVGSALRYTGIFVKDPSVTGWASFRDLSLASYRDKQREYTEANQVQVDAEHYSSSPTTTTAQYAGIWLQRAPSTLVSNLNVSAVSSWPANAQTALSNIQAQYSSYQGRVGFLFEDLTNGNYLGYRINEPFNLAGATKLLVAAHVLDRVDAGVLKLDQKIRYEVSDILERDYEPRAIDCTLPAPACGDWTVQQSLQYITTESSGNATDRMLRALGSEQLNEYLYKSGIVDIGEITSVCEVDKRSFVAQDSCVEAVDCFDFLRWRRHGEPPDTQPERDCVAKLSKTLDSSFESYYATLANSATPLQYARFLRKIVDAQMVLPSSRNELLESAMAKSSVSWMTSIKGTFYAAHALKGGDLHETDCVVGVGYGTQGVVPNDEKPQFILTIFTEDQPAEIQSNEVLAETMMQRISSDALTVLTANRK